MKRHTYGPWKYGSYGTKTGDTRFFVETHDNRHGICGIRPTDTASSLLTIEQHEANARLIASAPQMLSVLKLCDDLLLRVEREIQRCMPGDEEVRGLIRSALIEVTSAISKAEED